MNHATQRTNQLTWSYRTFGPKVCGSAQNECFGAKAKSQLESRLALIKILHSRPRFHASVFSFYITYVLNRCIFTIKGELDVRTSRTDHSRTVSGRPRADLWARTAHMACMLLSLRYHALVPSFPVHPLPHLRLRSRISLDSREGRFVEGAHGRAGVRVSACGTRGMA